MVKELRKETEINQLEELVRNPNAINPETLKRISFGLETEEKEALVQGLGKVGEEKLDK